jgi:uncharacterized protein (DUF362 family)
VSLVRTEDTEEGIRESIFKSIKLIEFNIDKSVRSVVIKPNLCYYWNSSTGYTTDPRVVSGIIDWVREQYGMDTDITVVEADATAMKTSLAFLMLGYEKMAKKKKVRLYNLSNDLAIEKEIIVNRHQVKFKIPQSLLNTDIFINVPKLKIMRETGITCAMKNMFGCISSPKKIKYHPILSEAIVGINKILHPNLVVVDSIVALGRTPKKLCLLMAGTNPFSIDWIVSQITGQDPAKIKFLRMALHEKMGRPEEILLHGESLESFESEFPRQGIISSRRLWMIQLGLLKMYNQIVGDIVPPVLED